MKKLLFILFICVSANAQSTLYSWYNSDTNDFLFSEFSDIQPPCDTIITENNLVLHRCSTTALIPHDWYNPKYNPQTNSFYNAATAEEQQIYIATKEASNTPADAASAVNTALTTIQPNSYLNSLYSNQGNGFLLDCPYTPYPGFEGSSVLYIKRPNGEWGRSFVTKNN